MKFKKFLEFLESLVDDGNAVLVVNTDAKFAEKILNGEKTIETRGRKLPPQFKGNPIELVTKYGNKKVSLGKVIFDSFETYTKNEEGIRKWERDRQGHLVPEGSKFDLPNRESSRPRYGWKVSQVERYEEPKEFPYPFDMGGLRVKK